MSANNTTLPPEGWRERLNEMRDAAYTITPNSEVVYVIFDSVIDALDELERDAPVAAVPQQEDGQARELPQDAKRIGDMMASLLGDFADRGMVGYSLSRRDCDQFDSLRKEWLAAQAAPAVPEGACAANYSASSKSVTVSFNTAEQAAAFQDAFFEKWKAAPSAPAQKEDGQRLQGEKDE